MTHSKQLWVLAGGNGAGKSTFYQRWLKPQGFPFINADVLAKTFFPGDPESHSYDAAQLATELRLQLLQEGRSFCFETVFSHPSKTDFVAEAKVLGCEVILVFIHLEISSLNLARVAQRVADGGHSVPEEKVLTRIPRVLRHIKSAIPLCDRVHLLDNSRSDDAFRQVATVINGNARLHAVTPPAWCLATLEDRL